MQDATLFNGLNGRARTATKFAIDLTLWLLATPLAFALRLDLNVGNFLEAIVLLMAIGLPAKALAIYVTGLPWRSWNKVGARDLGPMFRGVAFVTVFMVGVSVILADTVTIPRSVPLLEAMLAVLMLSAARLGTRSANDARHGATKASAHTPKGREMRQVLIVGAGEAGTMIAREMLRHPEAGLRPIGFADDDPAKRGKRFMGLPVRGTISDLPEILAIYRIDEVLIAMPSEAGDTVRTVVGHAQEFDVSYRIIPGVFELLSGEVAISAIREVDLEDLLRRDPVRLDVGDILDYVNERVVLVTGAGGSIGSEIVRQAARFGPTRLLLLDRSEGAVYQIARECRAAMPTFDVVPVICDLRDRDRLTHVFETYQPDVVFHAAAHKHVPLMEANPDEAVLNNVGGTLNLTELAVEFGVERFVNISTDKAVNPTSVMGATKRVAEYVVERAARRASAEQTFVSVRFGNVLGSSGSVVPLFKEQIRKGGPVTVTDPEMVRYFMTIPEAAQLVMQAGGLGANGRVYVLDMGDPVKIVDLARDLIRLSGFEPDVDIPVHFVGMRPGEKLYEELLTAEEGMDSSRHEKIFVARKHGFDSDELDALLANLFDAARSRQPHSIVTSLASIISTHMLTLPEEDFSAHRGDGSGDGLASSSRHEVALSESVSA